MRDSLTNPVHVYEGDDALITCVVKNIGENSVMWRKEDKERHSRRILTAGTTRVTADKRFAVLHDSGDFFVLRFSFVSFFFYFFFFLRVYVCNYFFSDSREREMGFFFFLYVAEVSVTYIRYCFLFR